MQRKFPEIPYVREIDGLGCWEKNAGDLGNPNGSEEESFSVRFSKEWEMRDKWNPSLSSAYTFPIFCSVLRIWKECQLHRITANKIECEMRKHCGIHKGKAAEIVKLITRGYAACANGIQLKPRELWEFGTACVVKLAPIGAFEAKHSWKRGGVGVALMRASEEQAKWLREYIREYGGAGELLPKSVIAALSLVMQRHARYVVCRLAERLPHETKCSVAESEAILEAVLAEHFPSHSDPVEWELPLHNRIFSRI